MPVFVYGGNWSLNPVENMFWIWDQVGANTGSKLLVFEDEFGVHTPWLNPGPSGGATGWFMVNLTEWVGARAKGSGVAW